MTIEYDRAERDRILAALKAKTLEWHGYAKAIIRQLGRARSDFTASDVWDVLERPVEPRALGPVLNDMVRKGEIVWTGELRPHTRRHHSKVQVWRLV